MQFDAEGYTEEEERKLASPEGGGGSFAFSESVRRLNNGETITSSYP